ncbi:MAG: HAMP domain-containing histidine kinase [Bacteroidetes bacterium]|jgi:two-component system NtrC family sensor kinase|nr:HAMP domain-containing histidine kinase [Bacteroidota bacterium]
MRFSSLRYQLFGGAAFLLLAFFGLYLLDAVWFHRIQMTSMVQDRAVGISDFIKSSTHYSMLQNRKDDVYQTMRSIARSPGIAGLRLYNKRGEVTFSSDSSEMGKMVDLQAEACIDCHAADRPLEAIPSGNSLRIYESSGERVLGLISTIRNEQSCSAEGCHTSPAEKTVLGVLDVRMSLARLDAEIARIQMIAVLTAAATLVLLFFVIRWFLRRTVLQPLDALMEGTVQVGDGNLDHAVVVSAKHELGRLARSFNEMVESVRVAQEHDRKWSETLEQRVKEKTDELKAIHQRILHVEKMTSLGRLSATVAHELNNPLAGILTYTKLLRRMLEAQRANLKDPVELLEYADIVIRETGRSGDIVKNLLLFSKKESGEFAFESLGEIVQRAYLLVRHHFDIRDVKFVDEPVGDEVQLLCDAQQIQQALVALFVNAGDAMPGGGALTVTYGADADTGGVRLTISDTGSGIDPEHLPKIFEPFFTTKEGGAGVGLGLSVVYGIVERHGGTIAVESAPGKGTTFILNFPPPRRESGA